MPGVGPEHFAIMRRYQQVAGFGVMLIDSVEPNNRVTWDPTRAQPRITYRLPEADKPRLRFAAQRGVEISFAAGAQEVWLPSEEAIGPLERPYFRRAAEAVHCNDLQFRPHQTTLTSSHSQATVKMSDDPRLGVTNSRGESHQVRQLLVCDASSFPASCGTNPMISIMTMARYQGMRIAGERARYGLH